MQYKNLNSDERREAVKLLYSNALSGIGVSALVSFVLVFAFDLTDERTNQEKIIWLFFMLVVLAARLMDVIYFNYRRIHFRNDCIVLHHNRINNAKSIWGSKIQ